MLRSGGGVYGEAASAGSGVSGLGGNGGSFTSSVPNGTGVVGKVTGAGDGVRGEAGAGGVGVRGVAPVSGWAGQFAGNVDVQGYLRLGFVTGPPPDQACDQDSEFGRLVVNNYGNSYGRLLWVCLAGWMDRFFAAALDAPGGKSARWGRWCRHGDPHSSPAGGGSSACLKKPSRQPRRHSEGRPVPSLPAPEPRLARGRPLPVAEYAYEAKWDGFRAIVSTVERLRVRKQRGWEMVEIVPEYTELAGCMIGAVHQLPTGSVTLLFTDIEGSTAAGRAGQRGLPRPLAEHRRVLREAFAARRRRGGHAGRCVSSRSAMRPMRPGGRRRSAPGPVTVRMGCIRGAAPDGRGLRRATTSTVPPASPRRGTADRWSCRRRRVRSSTAS